MKAVTFESFGGPEVVRLVDLPTPEPGKGEVVIKVAAATVNPTDVSMRAGRQAATMGGMQPPYIAGMEIAGHVHAVGEGVDRLTVGQTVMAIVSPRVPTKGGHAEYVAAPAASVVALAPGTDLIQASTIPMNALTAKVALEILALPPGSSLLVTGGAGALGGYVIELARYFGLVVIADAKEEDANLLRQLGAAHIVPRGEGMGAAVRALYPDGVDGLVDSALLVAPASDLVRDGGAAVAVRFSHPITDPRLRSAIVGVASQITNTAALVWLAELLDKGVLIPRIAKVLPASEAAEAHALVDKGGLRGRVVLTF